MQAILYINGHVQLVLWEKYALGATTGERKLKSYNDSIDKINHYQPLPCGLANVQDQDAV